MAASSSSASSASSLPCPFLLNAGTNDAGAEASAHASNGNLSSFPESLLDQIRARCCTVARTQTATYQTGLKTVEKLINRLEKAKRKLAKGDSHSVAEKLCNGLLEEKPHIALAREFKELYGTVLALGKSIDQNLHRESAIFETQELSNNFQTPEKSYFDPKEMANVMVYSLMRRGRFVAADSIVREMKIESPLISQTRNAFQKMHVCSKALKNKNIYPALRWTEIQERQGLRVHESGSGNKLANPGSECAKLQRSEGLRGKRKSINSEENDPNREQTKGWLLNRRGILRDLRFQLLKLRYLQLIQEESAADKITTSQSSIVTKNENNYNGNSSHISNTSPCLARPIEFARKELSKFASDRQRDIERLAGALLFATDLENSPYRDLYNEHTWKEVQVQFEAAFCQAHGFAGRDPLIIATLASDVAFPKRAKYAAVLRSQKGFVEQKDRPPPEINLGRSLQFHSTFVCPISKEQSTASNPPVLLSCGHVISREAMLKITRTRRGNRVKCPTCPTESSVSDVNKIKF